MKLLESSQIALVAGGTLDESGLPTYDGWFSNPSPDLPGVPTPNLLESPEEGTGPRPESGSPGLSQVLDTITPPSCSTWVTAGANSEQGIYWNVGFTCTKDGVGKP
jgi:hypothetical protein